MFGFHIILRLCFPLWLLTNILFFILLRYGAYFLTLTGLCMVTANILWATIRNYNELKIPFEDAVMEFTFGGSFYICLITGIFYSYPVYLMLNSIILCYAMLYFGQLMRICYYSTTLPVLGHDPNHSM